MIWPLFRRTRRHDTISALYGTIVAQARLPCFYRDYAIADTVNGRLDLLVLHLALVVNRLSGEDGALRSLGQDLFDHFCRDMDDHLREMGVGDLTVPKQMLQLGATFYGQAQAYHTAAQEAGDGALTEALARNVYGGQSSPAVARLAAYMREAVGQLSSQDGAAIARAELRFPDPAAIAVAA